MKKIKLLMITSVFSFLLVACGIKGPLYHPPVIEAPADVSETANDQQTDLQSEDEDQSLSANEE